MQVIREKNERIVRLERQVKEAQEEIQNLQSGQQAGSLNFKVNKLCEWAEDVAAKVLSNGSKGEVRDFCCLQEEWLREYMEQSAMSRKDLSAVFSYRLREQLLEMSRYRFQQLEEFSVFTVDRRVGRFELNP